MKSKDPTVEISTLLSKLPYPKLEIQSSEFERLVVLHEKLLDHQTKDSFNEISKRFKPLLDQSEIPLSDEDHKIRSSEEWRRRTSSNIARSPDELFSPLPPGSRASTSEEQILNAHFFKDLSVSWDAVKLWLESQTLAYEAWRHWLERCTGEWTLTPPFWGGHPTVEQTVPAPQYQNYPGYVSKSSRSFPEEGLLSLAAAGGNMFIDGAGPYRVYPMPDNWVFGDATMVRASIVEAIAPAQFGGMKRDSLLKVTAHLKFDADADQDMGSFGLNFPDPHIIRVIECWPGLEDDIGNGLIGAYGWVYLTVSGSTIPAKTNWDTFLTAIQNQPVNGTLTNIEMKFKREMDISTTIFVPLLTAPHIITINVAVQVGGIRWGSAQPHGGWVGCEFRDYDPNRTHPVVPFKYPWRPLGAGGPIQLTQIHATLCPIV